MVEQHRRGVARSRFGAFLRRVGRRIGWLVRDTWPNRWVEREVTGITMAMPWSHRLPDFARLDPAYGDNLLQLAEILGRESTIAVMDVGANIGDSSLLILDRTDARVLAVEPDEVFLQFLRHNVEREPRVVIEPSLLVTDEDPEGFTSVRIGGTATFVRDAGGTPVPTVHVEELRRRHPEFDSLRLVKSDTDGYDVTLVPAIARAWADVKPVLFFEYDHRASLAAGKDPLAIWGAIEELGYDQCAVWDNGGHPLFRTTTIDAPALARRHEPASPVGFWDVAAVHADDTRGRAALDELIPPG